MKQNKTKKQTLRTNETIINGSRVFVENGEVKVILSEEIKRAGGLTIEEAYELICAAIDKEYDMHESNM